MSTEIIDLFLADNMSNASYNTIESYNHFMKTGISTILREINPVRLHTKKTNKYADMVEDKKKKKNNINEVTVTVTETNTEKREEREK